MHIYIYLFLLHVEVITKLSAPFYLAIH